jgi:hypothetical protein
MLKRKTKGASWTEMVDFRSLTRVEGGCQCRRRELASTEPS